jgi:hypothetical protein
MFWFKRKKLVVDCFVNIPAVYELFKIDKANKFIPNEWKSLPAFEELKADGNPRTNMTVSVSTAKRCYALGNLFSTGFILPSWSDFGIEVLHDGTYNIVDPMRTMQQDTSSHPSWMYWDNLYKGYQHIKLSSPWLIREKSGVNFAWNQVDYQNTERYTNVHILSGIVDYKAQHDTHVNMFVKQGSVTHFKAGEPLVQIIPITESDVDIKCHLISDQEYGEMTRSYGQKVMWHGQHRELSRAKNESKCPFGFKSKI